MGLSKAQRSMAAPKSSIGAKARQAATSLKLNAQQFGGGKHAAEPSEAQVGYEGRHRSESGGGKHRGTPGGGSDSPGRHAA